MSWTFRRLGEVCDTTSGGTPLRSRLEYYDGDIPWVKSGDLNDHHLAASEENITELGLKSSSAKIFPKGTVLLAMYGATVGKLGLLEIEAATNQAICGITPSDDVDRQFLFYFLLSQRKSLIEQSIGGAQPNISQRIIRELLVPVPPLHEQHRIVDLLSRAEGIVRLRREAQAKAQAIIPALFLDIFGDPATNPKGWQVVSLSDVAEVISGIAKGRRLMPGEGIELPYMRVANVKDGYLDLGEVKTIEIKRCEIEKLLIQSGDLLMTEGGDPDKLGRAALWNGEVENCVHQNHVFKVRSQRDHILPLYLRSLAGSAYGKAYFLSVAKKTTGIASINKTQLSNFPVVLPPVALQERFAAQVAVVESIVLQQANALQKAEATFQALLTGAFSGDLTTSAHVEDIRAN
jgi:type I restriction enzyme S subunit